MSRRPLLVLTLLAACGSDPQTDAGTTDARPDATVAPDAAAPDAVAADAAPDAQVPDAGPPPAPVITTAELSAGVIGAAYSAALAADDGALPLVWSATGLPPGLAVNGSALTGVPSAAGDFTVELTVEDALARSDQRILALAVVEPLEILTSTLPAGRVAVAYTATLAARGGRPPFTWGIVAGALPLGLGLLDGQIFGRPMVTGDHNFTVEVTDTLGLTANAALVLHVDDTLAITTSTLPGAQAGQPYAATIGAAGGVPPYTWTLEAAPAALTLVELDPHDPLVELSGTPEAEGSFPVRVTVTDGAGYVESAELTLAVSAPYMILPETASATAGVPFAVLLSAVNGVAPHSFSITSGMLPAGLALTTDGAIEGTPLESGTFTIMLDASDGAGRQTTGALALEVINTLAIDASGWITEAGVLVPFSVNLTASGGLGVYTWSGGGGLPPGLTLDANGTISGAPSAVGTTSFVVEVTDGDVLRTAPLMLEVVDNFRIVTTTLPSAMTGLVYSAQLEAADGPAPYTFAIDSGALPPGITMDAGGALSGTPSAPGVFNFVVRATDAASTALTAPLAITVDTLVITPGPQPEVVLGQPFAWDLTASSGTAPYTWSLASGALPPGLSLVETGPSTARIEGNVAAGGTFDFVLEVTDALGATGELATSLGTVPVHVTTVTLPPVTFPYNATVEAGDGVPPYTWTHTLGDLPPGWTLSGATLSGDTFYGRYTFELTVTDQLGDSDVQRYSILGLAAADPIAALWPIPPSARTASEFVIGADTVRDTITNIEWTRASVLAPTYGDALAHCASLAHGGHLDWRVPTFIEMTTMYTDEYLDALAGVVDSPEPDILWTSTPASGGQYQSGGRRLLPVSGNAGLGTFCVRADPVAPQTRYSTVRGASVDAYTGLMWAAALHVAAREESNAWGVGACDRSGASGFTDWRVPSMKELFSANGPQTVGRYGHFGSVFLSEYAVAANGDLGPQNNIQYCVRAPQTGCGTPVADLGATPLTWPVGQVLTLDGSLSSVTGGCTAQHTWSIAGTQSRFAIVQDFQTNPTLDILPGMPGTYDVTLTVTVDGAQSTATRSIAVSQDPTCALTLTGASATSSIHVVASGGTPPYAYWYVSAYSPLSDPVSGWAGRSFHSTGFIPNDTLNAGCPSVDDRDTYQIIVVDAAGCGNITEYSFDCGA